MPVPNSAPAPDSEALPHGYDIGFLPSQPEVLDVEEGLYYPVNAVDGLDTALLNTIAQGTGRVSTDVAMLQSRLAAGLASQSALVFDPLNDLDNQTQAGLAHRTHGILEGTPGLKGTLFNDLAFPDQPALRENPVSGGSVSPAMVAVRPVPPPGIPADWIFAPTEAGTWVWMSPGDASGRETKPTPIPAGPSVTAKPPENVAGQPDQSGWMNGAPNLPAGHCVPLPPGVGFYRWIETQGPLPTLPPPWTWKCTSGVYTPGLGLIRDCQPVCDSTTPVSPPVSPPITPPYPVPPPPLPVGPGCVKVCIEGLEDLLKACRGETAKDCAADLWQTADCQLYAMPPGCRPKNEGDKKLSSGVIGKEEIKRLLDSQECGGKPEDKPDKPKPPVRQFNDPPRFGQALTCIPDILASLIQSQEAGSDLLDSFFRRNLGAGDTEKGQGLLDWFGSLFPPDTPGRSILQWFDSGGFGKVAAEAFIAVLKDVAKIGQFLLEGFTKNSACASPELMSIVLSNSVVGLIDKYLGGGVDFLRVPLEYRTGQLCQYRVPSPPETIQAYLANELELKDVKCVTDSNGLQWPWMDRVVRGVRSKLNPGEITSLYRRRQLSDADFTKRIRELGFTDQSIPGEFFKLSEQVPGPSDLVRMMVRDAADEGLVTKFGMDDEFGKKWSGKLKEWGYNQGVSDEYAKFIWRSHWAIPAPGQLFEMYHRLRNLPEGDPARVDRETIREALIQQDILPFWIDKFLAVSFRPLTRVDAKRAYQIGTIDKEQLKDSFLDQGYSDTNAKTMTDFTIRQTVLGLRSHKLVKRYLAYLIDSFGLQKGLEDEGFTNETFQPVLDWAREERQIMKRDVCLRQQEKRFRLGEFDDQETLQIIQGEGVSEVDAGELLEVWKCRRAAVGKQIPATKLCGLYQDGLLGEADFYQRLRRLTYSHDDAIALIHQCQLQHARKQDALRLKKLKQDQADLAKKLSATQKAEAERKKLAREIESQQRAAEKARESKAKKIDRRQKMVADAAGDVWKRGGGSLGELSVAIRSAVRAAVNQVMISEDLSHELAVIAAGFPSSLDFPTWSISFSELATAVDETARQAIIDRETPPDALS